jgi:predicted DCC family thiol-disulfide oxidoreductase YuxK
MSASSTTSPTPRPSVVFDGGCSFCRKQERRIRRLDWLGRFDTRTYDDAVEVWPEVGRGALGDGLRVRFPDGSVTIGVDAVRSIAVRLPLTALPALLLWIPGLHGIGAWGYGIVARRRQRDTAADDAYGI